MDKNMWIDLGRGENRVGWWWGKEKKWEQL